MEKAFCNINILDEALITKSDNKTPILRTNVIKYLIETSKETVFLYIQIRFYKIILQNEEFIKIDNSFEEVILWYDDFIDRDSTLKSKKQETYLSGEYTYFQVTKHNINL
jgi:hypothetical protein